MRPLGIKHQPTVLDNEIFMQVLLDFHVCFTSKFLMLTAPLSGSGCKAKCFWIAYLFDKPLRGLYRVRSTDLFHFRHCYPSISIFVPQP